MNEFLNILTKEKPYLELFKLQEEGRLEKLCPELSLLDENIKGHKNNFTHTMGVLKNVCDFGGDLRMRIVAVFHDIGKPKSKKLINGEWTFRHHEEIGAKMTMNIFDRMSIKDEKLRDYIYRMIYFHGRTKMHRNVTDSAIRRLTKDVGMDVLPDLIDFCKCDITTRFEDKRLRQTSALETIKNRVFEVQKNDEEAKWRSPLTGDVIMKVLNIKPSRLIGDIKREYDPLFKEEKITLEEAIEEIIIKYKSK